MGSIEDPSSKASSTIPIIDFTKWNHPTSPSDRVTVAQSLVDACRKVGFVYITNHGLPQDRITEAFDVSRRLFSLTHEEKMLAPHPDGSAVHRGYSAPGLEKIVQDPKADVEVQRQVADCRESYEIGSQDNAEQPNIWLPEETLPGFRSSMQDFYWLCHDVAKEILRALAVGIGMQDPETLIRLHSGANNQLRLAHYPAVPAEEMEKGRAARCPAHTDWSSITMLFQDDCGGLQVGDPHCPGEFVAATPIEGSCVVNIGDLLMRWSNDSLKSTMHRVTAPPLSDRYSGPHRLTRERFSIPYFVSPDPDALIETLPACVDAEHPSKYEAVTQKEYSAMRFKATYRQSADEAA